MKHGVSIVALALLVGAGCTTPSSVSPVATAPSTDTGAGGTAETGLPTDTAANSTVDTVDTGWPDALGNCLTSPVVDTSGLSAAYTDLQTLEEVAASRCVNSWRCTTTLERRGFVEEIAETDSGAYFDDTLGVVATWQSDDTAEVCYQNWTGMVIADCPRPADAVQSTGCVINVPGPVSPTLDPAPPFGPDNPTQLVAEHPCHAQAMCTVGSDALTVWSTSQGGDADPDVFVYDGPTLVASGNAAVWHGPEATVSCIEVARTPSDACGLVE